MRKGITFLFLGSFWLLSAARPDTACTNAESMIGFVENHLKTALGVGDLELSRYHTYKAINTMEKSRDQFEACGCEYAKKNIFESLDNLKLATKISSLEGTRILLRRALEGLLAGEEALEQHDDTHDSPYASDVLAMNTSGLHLETTSQDSTAGKKLEARIDASLEAYRKSLDEVVESVPCREAQEFVQRIYDHCERQLLREDLTPAKRYYNVRTKALTEDALERLEGCSAR